MQQQQTRILQPVSRMTPGSSNLGHFDKLIMTLSDKSQRDNEKFRALKVCFKHLGLKHDG